MTDIVYGNLKVNSKTKEDLISYLERIGIQSNNTDDFHCTFIYSRNIDKSDELMLLGDTINQEISTIPVSAQPVRLQYLGDSLALILDSEVIESYFQQAIDIGAEYDWPDYLCHLSLTYLKEGDQVIDLDNLPIPDFTLSFNQCEVIMSDDDYDPVKENETEEVDLEGFGTVSMSFGESLFRNYVFLDKIEEANKTTWSQYWIAKVAKRVKRPTNKLKWKGMKDKQSNYMLYLHDVEKDVDYLAYDMNKKELIDWIDTPGDKENWSQKNFDIEKSVEG